jgi:hypothetical protein
VLIPALIRFVKEEDAFLSPTNGGARLYINMDDYDSYLYKKRKSSTASKPKNTHLIDINVDYVLWPCDAYCTLS